MTFQKCSNQATGCWMNLLSQKTDNVYCLSDFMFACYVTKNYWLLNTIKKTNLVL